MGDHRGGTIPSELLAAVPVPALVLRGASPDWMSDIARQMADALPHGRCRVLEGEEHVVAPAVLAPVVAELVAGSVRHGGYTG